MGEAVFEIAFQFICYYTAKIILPVMSFGYIRVLGPSTNPPRSWWGERWIVRLPNGSIGLQSDFGAFIGMLIWFTAIIFAVLWFRS